MGLILTHHLNEGVTVNDTVEIKVIEILGTTFNRSVRLKVRGFPGVDEIYLSGFSRKEQVMEGFVINLSRPFKTIGRGVRINYDALPSYNILRTDY